ncbi:MAG: hypothetical protein ACE5HJ_08825, partial [Thermoplasmata archaeon]
GSHPSLGALVGLAILAIFVPYTLDYGLMGFGLSLFVAGLVAGGVARGGARIGAGSGARAAGIFMLLLLISWALILLGDQGLLDFSSSPEVAEFMPYVVLMEGLWERIATLLEPTLQVFVAMAGGDIFVELLLKVLAPAIPAAIGGAVAGAATGRPEPRPLPVAVNPQYAPPYSPPYYPGNPSPSPPPELAYLCPWCGLKVLPHMVKCWNCGGPLQLPPPPPY